MFLNVAFIKHVYKVLATANFRVFYQLKFHTDIFNNIIQTDFLDISMNLCKNTYHPTEKKMPM